MSNVVFFDYEDEAIYNSDFLITPVINGWLPSDSFVKILFPNIPFSYIAEIIRMTTSGLNSGDVCGITLPTSTGTNIPIFLINFIRGVHESIPDVVYDERQIMKCMSIIENIASGVMKPYTPFLNAISRILVEYPTDHSGGLFLYMYQTYGTDKLTRFLESSFYQGDINLEALPF